MRSEVNCDHVVVVAFVQRRHVVCCCVIGCSLLCFVSETTVDVLSSPVVLNNQTFIT